MKEYYDTKRRKSESFLYYGLISAAFAVVMLAAGVISLLKGAETAFIVTGFAGGGFWVLTAFCSLYVYYYDNKVVLNKDEFDETKL